MMASLKGLKTRIILWLNAGVVEGREMAYFRNWEKWDIDNGYGEDNDDDHEKLKLFWTKLDIENDINLLQGKWPKTWRQNDDNGIYSIFTL